MVTTRALAIACLIVGAAAADAAADAAGKLAQARAAIEAVQYDRAQALLGEALRDGGSTAQAVSEIYALAASTAVVLGSPELAEQYYRRLLAVDPKATLDAELAPKFKQPFAAAQAYINAHGALRASARRLSRDALEIVVESDPLAMVTAVALASAPTQATALDADHRAVIATSGAAKVGPASASHGAEEICLLDEFGNQLGTLPAPLLVAAPLERGPERARRSTPLLRTWWVWAIPSGVALAVGIGAGAQARSASSDLSDLLDSDGPYYGDAEDLRERYRSRTTIANVAFATAGTFAAVAAIVWVTRPRAGDRRTSLVPVVSPDGVIGLGLSGSLR